MRQKLKNKRRTKQAPSQRITLPPASQTVSTAKLADSKYRTIWQISREFYEKVGKHILVYEAGQPLRYALAGNEDLTEEGRAILEVYNPRTEIAVVVVKGGEAITYVAGPNSEISQLRVQVRR